MVQTQSHMITYSHPFAAVTSSLWSKYDSHKYVRDVEVIDRCVDARGRLHSTRVISMGGRLPVYIQPFVPMKLVHLKEVVIVDPHAQTMEVEVTNISCKSVMDARSLSRYTPCRRSPDSTTYEIDIAVQAFPRARDDEAVTRAQDAVAPGSDSTGGLACGHDGIPRRAHDSATSSEWTLELVRGGLGGGTRDSGILARWQQGYVAGQMESWAVNKLLSNVNKGEQYIDSFCQRWRQRHTMLCDYDSQLPPVARTPSPSPDTPAPPCGAQQHARNVSAGVHGSNIGGGSFVATSLHRDIEGASDRVERTRGGAEDGQHQDLKTQMLAVVASLYPGRHTAMRGGVQAVQAAVSRQRRLSRFVSRHLGLAMCFPSHS